MAGKLSGIAVAECLAGFVLFWSGYKNTKLKDTLTSLLHGQNPAGIPEQAPTIGVTSGNAAIGSVNGPAIASDALKYKGHCYKWGGAPGTNGAGCWDCSSFCNWVLGHDMSIMLPGESSRYDGTSHGPTTLSYLGWTGATTVGHSASDAQAGDLCVWQTHMGIATGNGQMISALDPAQGTEVTSIGAGPSGEVLFVRRLK